MRRFILLTAAIAVMACSNVQAERINLGSDPGMFFDDAGFTPGDTSFTRLVTIDGVDLELTVEGFDSGGAAAGLVPTARAVGVGNDRLDVDEVVKFTFNTVAPITEPIVNLSSLQMAAFDPGEEYTVEVAPPGGAILGTTPILQVDTSIEDGSMVTITGMTGSTRAQWLSLSAEIPEPSSLGLAAFGLLFFVRKIRRQ